LAYWLFGARGARVFDRHLKEQTAKE